MPGTEYVQKLDYRESDSVLAVFSKSSNSKPSGRLKRLCPVPVPSAIMCDCVAEFPTTINH